MSRKLDKNGVMISIIMPVYNAEPFLEECLNSIIEQSYVHWELIAIDDFSNDNSLKILKTYQAKDYRISVFGNTSKGITPALKNGYKHASGSFITRMDADDIMVEHKLELLYKEVSKSQGVAVGKVSYFADGKELREGYRKYADWLNSMIEKKDHYKHIYRECVLPSPCWMIGRAQFEEIRGFETLDYPEDYDLVFRLYKHKIPVLPVNSVLHLWRDHEMRASRNDPNYTDQGFLSLKIHYFLDIDHDKEKPLMLWGAGSAGKQVAKLLISKEIKFKWITNNIKKIGKDIYDARIHSADCLKNLTDSQIITAIKTTDFFETEVDTFIKLHKFKNDVFNFY